MQVTLDSGHNLAIRDKSGACIYCWCVLQPCYPLPFPLPTGSSDPYVKFKQEHFKYKSAVINQNLNPQWNEIISFKTTDLSSPLHMQVFDHDYGSADDFMGAASVNLDEFADGQYVCVFVHTCVCVMCVCVCVCMLCYVRMCVLSCSICSCQGSHDRCWPK